MSAGAIVPMPAAGCCDCHIHVNDPQYAYDARADLRPPAATVAMYRQVQQLWGVTRVVVVQPSSYGLDNRCTLAAVAALQAQGTSARAVVVVDEGISDAALRAMHEQGARGVRLNLLRPSPVSAQALRRLAERITSLGWHIQLHAGADAIAELASVLRDLPVPVVFDHMGRLPLAALAEGGAHPAAPLMLELLANGRAWIKLSGLELEGPAQAPDYPAHAAWAARLIEAAPQRLVWGSNWPHPATACRGETLPDPHALFDWILRLLPTAALRQAVLSDNPAQLYGFDTGEPTSLASPSL